MRCCVILAAATIAVGVGSGVARAQAAPPAPPASAGTGYIEGVAQSSFGSVTSQAYGAEGGVTVWGNMQVFGEVSHVNDTATSSLATGAQAMANYLAETQSNVGYHAEQPTTFGVGGVRFRFPVSPKVEPYVLIGAGVAQVKRNVTFSANGSDVTGNLAQYGVVLGTDLSGSQTKAMLSLGGGVAWTPGKRLIVDFQYRYGRVFVDDGLNINRAGVGIGVRF